MRLEQLKYVAEIYHTHSLSQAAKNLSLSQPSLSNALAALEEEWGVKLFHRLTTGVIPTEEGERLIPQITEALSELDRLYAVRSQPSAAGSICCRRLSWPFKNTIRACPSPYWRPVRNFCWRN